MKLKAVIKQGREDLLRNHSHHLLPGHRKALDAICACRSQCGDFTTACAGCHRYETLPLSCGHRNCPQCQHHLGEQWLERQMEKLLPVKYLMVTFTLPQELRGLAWSHQDLVYGLMFKAAHEALVTIGRNNHRVDLGMTMVLHTHQRNKEYHPHVHVMVPAGGLTKTPQGEAWKPLAHDYLINEFALAKVFSGIFLRLLFAASLPLPAGLPKQWVAHIKKVGKGEKALRYLSQYLYRGVISENDILCENHQGITFRYRDSDTGSLVTRTLSIGSFIWKLMMHVLPRGFRRVRDYGFLHHNAKLKLRRIQLRLKVRLPKPESPEKTRVCAHCQGSLRIVEVSPKAIPRLFRNNDMESRWACEMT